MEPKFRKTCRFTQYERSVKDVVSAGNFSQSTRVSPPRSDMLRTSPIVLVSFAMPSAGAAKTSTCGESVNENGVKSVTDADDAGVPSQPRRHRLERQQTPSPMLKSSQAPSRSARKPMFSTVQIKRESEATENPLFVSPRSCGLWTTPFVEVETRIRQVEALQTFHASAQPANSEVVPVRLRMQLFFKARWCVLGVPKQKTEPVGNGRLSQQHDWRLHETCKEMLLRLQLGRDVTMASSARRGS